MKGHHPVCWLSTFQSQCCRASLEVLLVCAAFLSWNHQHCTSFQLHQHNQTGLDWRDYFITAQTLSFKMKFGVMRSESRCCCRKVVGNIIWVNLVIKCAKIFHLLSQHMLQTLLIPNLINHVSYFSRINVIRLKISYIYQTNLPKSPILNKRQVWCLNCW